MDTPFDISSLDAADESKMQVTVNGATIDWWFTFCGPGHPQAVAQSNRIAREQLSRNRAKEQATTNGKKWRAPDQSPDELLADNVDFVMERLLGWSPVQLGGEDYPFSQDNARKLLTDRKKGALLQQAIEFLLDDNSFMKRSAKI